jgi:hypothetical protein
MKGVAVADRVLRAGTCAGVLALGLYGFARPEAILLPGLAWFAFLLCALIGLGTVVAWLVRAPDADAGLRAAWGTVAYLVLAGVLIGAGVCSRPAVLTFIGLGIAVFVGRELVTDRPVWRRCVDAVGFARREPGTAAVIGLVAAVALIHVVGAVARVEMNAYDDDVGYAALVKRLLDIGDLNEPFSFRRMSAYGGQTALEALGGARGTLLNAYLVDRGLFQIISLLLLVGYAREKRVPAYWTALVAITLLMLPETSINIASHWSGMALVVAMYRTTVRMADAGADAAAATRHLVLLAGTAAVIGTLRQNFLPVSVLALVLVLGFRLHAAARAASWRAAWRAERRAWLVAVITGAVCIAPYAIASWTSNRTFLYPFMPGTFNTNLSLRPEVFTLGQELKFFSWVFLEAEPIRVFPLLLPLVLMVADRRPGRPLVAFLVGNLVGLVLLIHGFTLSDPGNLWRYAFGYAAGLTLLYALEVGALGVRPDEPDAPVRIPLFARVAFVLVLLAQVAVVRNHIPRDYREISADIREAIAHDRHPGAMTRELAARYRDLQAALPAGARLASMVDDPYYYDYARHEIINLDVPGYASWAPGLPSFRGAEAMRTYFLGHGIRYVAYVRGDLSRYLYRREFWVRRIFVDAEIWRIMGSYIVDTLDNFDELAATSAVLFERDGTLLLDLEARR